MGTRTWAEIAQEMDGGDQRETAPVDSIIEPQSSYYPGSSTPIPEELPPPPRDEIPDQDPSWRAMGKAYRLEGKNVMMFPIGALARALGREPTTIRSWEQKGWIPKPSNRGAQMGHGGHRRLYTADQIERLIAAAHECGLLVDVSSKRVLPGKTDFPRLAHEIFGVRYDSSKTK